MTDQPSEVGFATLAIHAGTPPGPGSRAEALGPTGMGIHGDQAGDTPFALRLFEGRPATQGDTPQAILEERIAALEGGSAALAVASGEAARLIACHTLMQAGDEIVVPRPSRGWPASFNESFKSFGWHAKWADPEETESFVEALSDKTKAILIESLAGSGGIVADIQAIARVAQRARVPLIVDNSLATPFLARPLEHGADIVLYSSSRFLGGSGSTAGLIVDGGTFDWANDARYPALTQPIQDQGGMIISEAFGNFAFAVACRVFGARDLGSAALPLDAAATVHGIETLPLRLQRHCETALAVARYLAGHPAVSGVRYAGLPRDKGHVLAQRYCPNGAGAAFTFTLAGGYQAGVRLVRRLKLFSALVAVGDTRSQVVHPASADGRGIDAGPTSGVASDVVQVSIGLEDSRDIIADLDQALAG